MKKTTKLTRSTFKRKLVIFGVSIFAALALTATGFATWIISANAKKVEQGNISVGVTEDATITIADITLSNPDILFEPAANDYEGRVQADKPVTNDDSTVTQPLVESLSATFTDVEVRGAKNIRTLTVTLFIPEGVKEAIDKNYIVLVGDWTAGTELVEETFGEGEEVVTLKGYNYTATFDITADWISLEKAGFTMTREAAGSNIASFSGGITFAWGTEFGGMNPSLYYDTEGAGLDVANDTVIETLDDLRATIYGVESLDTYKDEFGEFTDAWTALAGPQYKLTIEAKNTAE